ncbi:hypothetical protein OG613_47545 (plasmid) [Streptomyces sp. NBC_00015]|uniref:hypothetical protein n=1 Tax=Streptomyces sp. NBC_00015 TaxID=2903611 RepID=UPI002F90F027
MPITVIYLSLPSRVSAFCAVTPERGVIIVDAQASQVTQMTAIARELGYLLFDDLKGHEESTEARHAGLPPMDLAPLLAPALNPDAVAAFFERSHYDSRIERMAEAFATVMLERKITLRAPDRHRLSLTF